MSEAIKKKQIGAYYTPQRAARLLVTWALRTEKETLLEPSFGGCGFLAAAHRRLHELDCLDPLDQLFGYDIDERAFHELQDLFTEYRDDPRLKQHFKQKNFLLAKPDSVPRFNAVVGNPPYISYHSMNERQREIARASTRESNYCLDQTASLWAYFVLHALNFLKPGGRIAWILPGSLLQTEYASSVRSIVSKQFERAIALQLNERLFLEEGTEENSVILLADGWSQEESSDSLEVGYVATLNDLEKTVNAWQHEDWKGSRYDCRVGFALMENDTEKALSLIEDKLRVRSLGHLANIRIGIVTGANDFFVINKERADANDLERGDLKYILPKFRLAPGLSLTEADFDAAYDDNERCLLADGSVNGEAGKRLAAYFDTFDSEKKKANATFKKRGDWRQPDDAFKPDAFFPYMHQNGPRLVLNDAGVNSTNTIHRIYFENDLLDEVDSTTQRKVLTISMLSTYSQLSAEMEGRAYGSGVLKHEPSEARRIKLIIPQQYSDDEVDRTFGLIDKLLRKDRVAEAEDEANAFVLRCFSSSVMLSVVQRLKTALNRARDRRSVKRNGH